MRLSFCSRTGSLPKSRSTILSTTSSFSTITSTPSTVSVVSTASRGIGLEFAKQLLKSQPANHDGSLPVVVALCRSVTNDLLTLQAHYPSQLRIIDNFDLTCQDSISAAGDKIKADFACVDMLFNVAAILGDGKTESEGPERSLEKIDANWLTRSMQVNLVGHILMTQSLFPLMIAASKRNQQQQTALKHYPRVVNISARVGSISDNRLGGWYSYRISKAALNQFTKTLSIEGKRHKILSLSCHPGTTNTDLSRPFQANVKPDKLFSVEYSVSSMLNVIRHLKPEDSGKFFAYDGTEIQP